MIYTLHTDYVYYKYITQTFLQFKIFALVLIILLAYQDNCVEVHF